MPKVSICVPNLNTLPFLEERFETIFNQTLSDWELLVYDSFSEDGAWEYIQKVASTEPRMKAWQGPREGTPGSWSPCIKEATGEYVYIATSDDTMPPDFLEKMVASLDANPNCGLAHAELMAIDENGKECEENAWWRSRSLFSRSSGDWFDKYHVRKAPFDGLLHILGETVYISITQLLIRRSLFDQVGMFDKDWGAPGDYAWDMRAGLVTDTVHVPTTWGGWRLHSGQATDKSLHQTSEYLGKIDEMISNSLERCAEFVEPSIMQEVLNRWKPLSDDHRRVTRELKGEESRSGRALKMVAQAAGGSVSARHYLKSRLKGDPLWVDSAPDILRGWLEEKLAGPVFVAASNEVGR